MDQTRVAAWAQHLGFALLAAGMCVWSAACGDFALGAEGLVPMAPLAILVLLPSMGAAYVYWALDRKVPRLIAAIAALALIDLAFFNPWMSEDWRLRRKFVTDLKGLVGATTSQARIRMGGYIGPAEHGYEPQFRRESIPDGVEPDTVLSYRWNDTDGRYNSDVGEVFLLRGRVVAVEFLPD